MAKKRSWISQEEYKLNTDRGRHSVYNLYYHLILVTKFRKPCITEELFRYLKAETERLFEARGMVLAALSLFALILFSRPVLAGQVQKTYAGVDVPGNARFRIAVVNDLHIIAGEKGVQGAYTGEVRARMGLFRSASGTKSAAMWSAICGELNSSGADLVVFAGDMVDFFSDANFSLLKKRLKKLKIPYIYLRADHDLGKKYAGKTSTYVKEKENRLCDNSPVIVREYGKFTVVGINKSTSNLTKAGLKTLKSVWKSGRPVILFTHVPFEPRKSGALVEKSKRTWGNRVLLWGGGKTYYSANKYTKAFLKMLYSKNSPVRAVFAGHLHFGDKSMLTAKTVQYVLDASYKGKIGIVDIR